MHPALTPGAHSITVDSIVQRYHVHGAGPSASCILAAPA